MLFPNSGVELNPLLLLALGLTVGVLSSFFGFGGGFMLTPGLNIFGLPMTFAVGTDLTHIMGTSVIATAKHRQMGQVDFRLGLLLVLGTIPGLELGKTLLLSLDRGGQAEPVVRYVYMALLGGLGVFMLLDYFRWAAQGGSRQASEEVSRGRLAERIQRWRTKPIVSLPASDISHISLWVPAGLGLLTGVLAGLLGVGGGFILMPALIYVMGVPIRVVVGTQLFGLILTAAYGSFTYALANRVELLAVVFMMLGASAGAQVGAIATRYVSGAKIRFFYALTILLAGVSVALKQAASYFSLSYLSDWAAIVLLAGAGGMSLLIAGLLLSERVRRRKTGEQGEQ